MLADDALLSELSNNADVGAIEVNVKRVFAEGRPVSATAESFKSVGAMHERSKKAGADAIVFTVDSAAGSNRHRAARFGVTSAYVSVMRAALGDFANMMTATPTLTDSR